MNRSLRTVALVVLAFAFVACAVRLGGPSPEEYDTIVLYETRDADAAAVAQRIRSAGADIVLLAAERQDSAWFAYLASQAQLPLSGPGSTGPHGYAFLTSLELLGDTSLALDVPGGGRVHMHDALYRIDEFRFIDLMLVRLEGQDLRAAVRTLFGYIATDVSGEAALFLAVDGPTTEAADSVAVLMRATLANAQECTGASSTGERPIVRLLYGPSARVRCRSARIIPGTMPGIGARLEVGR